MYDDDLLDSVAVARLSDRQLLERLVRTIERIEAHMSVDEDYLKAALSSLDVQVGNLGIRVQGWADQLTQAAQNATDFQSLRETVNQVAAGVQADAVAISNMAQPSQVANSATPVQATPVPTDTTDPISTDGTSAPAASSTPAASAPVLPGPDLGTTPPDAVPAAS